MLTIYLNTSKRMISLKMKYILYVPVHIGNCGQPRLFYAVLLASMSVSIVSRTSGEIVGESYSIYNESYRGCDMSQ